MTDNNSLHYDNGWIKSIELGLFGPALVPPNEERLGKTTYCTYISPSYHQKTVLEASSNTEAPAM